MQQINYGPSPSFKPPKTTSMFLEELWIFTRYMEKPNDRGEIKKAYVAKMEELNGSRS